MLNRIAIASVATWEQLFSFLSEIIHYRMKATQSGKEADFPDIQSFLSEETLKELPSSGVLTEVDLLALTLALTPHMQPELLPDLLSSYLSEGKEFPEMGLIRGKNRELFFPTGDTLLYLLAGKDLEARMHLMHYFQCESQLFRTGILSFEDVPAGEPRMSGRLLADEEYVDIITTGAVQKPRLGSGFPAQLIASQR